MKEILYFIQYTATFLRINQWIDWAENGEETITAIRKELSKTIW